VGDRDAWSTCLSYLSLLDVGRLNATNRGLEAGALDVRTWQHERVRFSQHQLALLPIKYRRLVRKLDISQWKYQAVDGETFVRLLEGYSPVEELDFGRLLLVSRQAMPLLQQMLRPFFTPPVIEASSSPDSGVSSAARTRALHRVQPHPQPPIRRLVVADILASPIAFQAAAPIRAAPCLANIDELTLRGVYSATRFCAFLSLPAFQQLRRLSLLDPVSRLELEDRAPSDDGEQQAQRCRQRSIQRNRRRTCRKVLLRPSWRTFLPRWRT
jgi:hypothetical protein